MDVTATHILQALSPRSVPEHGSVHAGDSGKPLPPSGKALPARPTPAPPSANIDKVVAQIKDWLRDSGRQLDFQIDESSGRTVITVRNPATGEVIRQIPSEEVLQLAYMLASGSSLGVDQFA